MGLTNKQIPLINSDENFASSHYQISKRPILTNSIQTQTLPSLFNQSDHHSQQQKLKALNDETLSKTEKIQALLRELADCQVSISEIVTFHLQYLTRSLQVLIFDCHCLLLFSFFIYALQVIIKQQEQQLANGKKDRDQLYFIVDERTNELRNLKQKNEQLEQMIRNGK